MMTYSDLVTEFNELVYDKARAEKRFREVNDFKLKLMEEEHATSQRIIQLDKELEEKLEQLVRYAKLNCI